MHITVFTVEPREVGWALTGVERLRVNALGTIQAGSGDTGIDGLLTERALPAWCAATEVAQWSRFRLVAGGAVLARAL